MIVNYTFLSTDVSIDFPVFGNNQKKKKKKNACKVSIALLI